MLALAGPDPAATYLRSTSVGGYEDTTPLADLLAGEVRSGDVVLVLGGGRSYRIGERLLERLEAMR